VLPGLCAALALLSRTSALSSFIVQWLNKAAEKQGLQMQAPDVVTHVREAVGLLFQFINTKQQQG